MVRVKSKKAKGDDAFVKRKQKVGRKKLAPVTATQADVHARTLRISTSSSLAAAGGLGAQQAAASRGPTDAITPGSKRPRDHGEKDVDFALTTITAHSFAELLAGTQHYKASQRASAFASMAKLLTLQAQKDAAAARAGHDAGASGYVVLPSTTATASASAPTAPPVLSGVQPLEKLKCFSAALEAMTDTDDLVRRAALHGLRTILEQSDFFSTPDGSEDSEEMAAIGEEGADDDGVAPAAGAGAGTRTSTTQLDHVVAVLQAVHVSLTHAMKPVRLSGVELLGLLLHTAPPQAVRAAARIVCRQEQAYLKVSEAPLMGSLGMGAAGAAASPTATTAGATAAQPQTQGNGEAEARVEEEWMLTLVRRVSALVLRTEHTTVLAKLLDTLLHPQALLVEMGQRGEALAPTRSAARGQDTCWQHPALVKDLFDELLPKWANLWRELMEMRLLLLRQEGKLLMAAALAQCFATVLTFLKAQSAILVRRLHAQRALAGASPKGSAHSANYLFPRTLVQYARELLIQRIPVTLAEVLKQDVDDKEASGHCGSTSQSSAAVAASLLPATVGGARRAGSSTTARSGPASAAKIEPRLQLALALARVAVPLAGTDDGWKLLHHFLCVVFSYDSHRPATASTATTTAAAGAKAPYVFHSARELLSCVQTFRLALQLYPPAPPEEAVTPQSHQHMSVLRKLIPFVPSILYTVTRQLVKAVRPPHHRGSGERAVEDAIVLRQLALVADVMQVVTRFPLSCSSTAPGTDAAVSASTARADQVLGQSVEQALLLLPRLLFALRWQQRETTATEAAAVRKRVQRVGVLPHSTRALDRTIRQLLLCVWSVASSGHPLTLSSSSSGTGAFSARWLSALLSLYGLCKPDGTVVAEGVLARCTAATTVVARDALIYLGVRDSEKLIVHRLEWADVDNEWRTAEALAEQSSSSPVYSIADMLAMLPV